MPGWNFNKEPLEHEPTAIPLKKLAEWRHGHNTLHVPNHNFRWTLGTDDSFSGDV